MKTKKTTKPKVTLVSYSIKATIPTGAYANIIPEITVKAGTLEEAEKFCFDHLKHLIDTYSEHSKANTTVKKVQGVIIPQNTASEVAKTGTDLPLQSLQTQAYLNAYEQFISFKAKEDKAGLTALGAKVSASIKLSDTEKGLLSLLIKNELSK